MSSKKNTNQGGGRGRGQNRPQNIPQSANIDRFQQPPPGFNVNPGPGQTAWPQPQQTVNPWSNPPIPAYVPPGFSQPATSQSQQASAGQGKGKKKQRGPQASFSPQRQNEPINVPVESQPNLSSSPGPTQSQQTTQGKSKNKKMDSQASLVPDSVPQAPSVIEQVNVQSEITPQDTAAQPIISNVDGPSTEQVTGGGKKKKKGPQASLQPENVMTQKKSSLQSSFPQRPDTGGSLGTKLQVLHNSYDIMLKEKLIYMYRFSIENCARFKESGVADIPIKLSVKMKKEYAKILVDSQAFGKFAIHDGFEHFWTSDQGGVLQNITNENIKRSAKIADPLGRGDINVEYTIMKVSELNTLQILNFISQKRSIKDIPQDIIRFLDCIIRALCLKDQANVGRNAYFLIKPERTIAEKMIHIHRGFSLSVRPQWKLRLNIDMTCKAFLAAGKASDILYNTLGDQRIYDKRSIENYVMQVRMETNYQPYKRRLTCFGASDKPANQLKIQVKQENGSMKEMTVHEYFIKQYNKTCQYPDLPCLKMNKERDVWIPMEMLDILPFQEPKVQRELLAQDVIKCAAVPAKERFNEIAKYAKNLAISSKSNQLTANYSLDLNLLGGNQQPMCEAREMPQPKAQIDGAIKDLGRGKWNINRFASGPVGRNRPIKWAIVCVGSVFNDKELLKSFASTGQKLGVSVEPSPVTQPVRALPADLRNKLENLAKQGADLVLIVLNNKFVYGQIKCFGDLNNGIRTQCVMDNTLSRFGVVNNLWLKVNGKLGGKNWIVQAPRLDNNVMVLGADVTHGARGFGPNADAERRSLAAVVGSYSLDLMHYACQVTEQPTCPRGRKDVQEMILNMDKIVVRLLKTFFDMNNRFPDKIIMYRDGVSEGQFETVLVEELDKIQKACLELRMNPLPKITYIVVQKRHHIRFAPNSNPPIDNRTGKPRNHNVNAGTIVDTMVTSPRDYDFYLCSHEGIQGTSKPAHYYVLYDDSNLVSNDLQTFTYALCHAYMRCTRSVSIPAPTYYAHLAAYRAREWQKSGAKPEKEYGNFALAESQKRAMFYL